MNLLESRKIAPPQPVDRQALKEKLAAEALAGISALKLGERRAPGRLTTTAGRFQNHLLPVLKDYRLSEIDVALVDHYKTVKMAEGKLAPAQINKTLKRLAQLLEARPRRLGRSRFPDAGLCESRSEAREVVRRAPGSLRCGH